MSMSDGETEDWFESREKNEESDDDSEAETADEMDADAFEASVTGASDTPSESPDRGPKGPQTDDFGPNVFGGDGDDDPFGSTDSTPDEHPAQDDGDEGEGGGLFDQDFAAEMGSGGFGGAEEEFEDDIDSAIPRIDLGIDGLDAMIRGGVPERSLMVAIGAAGCGKTTFGLQFIHQGLSQGERAVYIALDESRDRVITSADEKGFDFSSYVESGQLAVVDMDPADMANSLRTIQSELPRLIDEFGASRLVLDSVSLLEMMYEDRATRRNEIYDFARALKEAGVTTMMTSEADDDNPYASRYSIIEYLVDAVFILRYVRTEDFQETRMAVEIQKIRDAHHSRNMKPYEITDEGITVHEQATLF